MGIFNAVAAGYWALARPLLRSAADPTRHQQRRGPRVRVPEALCSSP